MNDIIVGFLIFIALIGLGELVLRYFMLRELGEIDKDRTDWWEKLADRFGHHKEEK